MIAALRDELDRLKAERAELADYVTMARQAISEVGADHLRADALPAAMREMEAVTAATEGAANRIMEAAEQIMRASTDDDARTRSVNEACIAIMEACSFQDLTGQRLSKVLKTLTAIDTKLARLQATLAIESTSPVTAVQGDAALMNGPALPDQAMSQDMIDQLLG
jgi:chemotaxis protein CheZ